MPTDSGEYRSCLAVGHWVESESDSQTPDNAQMGLVIACALQQLTDGLKLEERYWVVANFGPASLLRWSDPGIGAAPQVAGFLRRVRSEPAGRSHAGGLTG